MQRILACLSLCAVTGGLLTTDPAQATTTPKPAVKATKKPVVAIKRSPVAPADEYFGRLKMSILGIRNTIKDLGIKIDTYPDKAESIFGTADLTEDAIRDWQQKYPKDSWLPGTYYALSHMYTKVPTDEARKRAKRAMATLVAKFPQSKFGRDGKRELASNAVGAPIATIAADAPSPSATGSGQIANGPATPQPNPTAAAVTDGFTTNKAITITTPAPNPTTKP